MNKKTSTNNKNEKKGNHKKRFVIHNFDVCLWIFFGFWVIFVELAFVPHLECACCFVCFYLSEL